MEKSKLSDESPLDLGLPCAARAGSHTQASRDPEDRQVITEYWIFYNCDGSVSFGREAREYFGTTSARSRAPWVVALKSTRSMIPFSSGFHLRWSAHASSAARLFCPRAFGLLTRRDHRDWSAPKANKSGRLVSARWTSPASSQLSPA
jgi:hypothetical protein